MKKLTRTGLAVVCLVVGIFVGVAGAQITTSLLATRFLNSGLFSMSVDDRAIFAVSLDDNATAQPATVRLQFLDEAGAVAASRDAVLQPGASTRLELSGPGAYRAHARVLESTDISARHAVMGSVEVFDLVAKHRRPVCSLTDAGVDGGKH